MTDRARAVAIGGALAVCLIAGSPPRIVGDGGEYVAQAMNFTSFNAPPLGRRAILEIEPRIRALAPDLGDWTIADATVSSVKGGRDFLHFWFYALVATPALWLVDAAGAPATYAFAITNLVLVLAALWVVIPRVGSWAALLLFAGPLVWWVDKAHTEVFTVSLMAIALALMRDRPAVAMIAAGAAATQNLPVGIVFAALVVHGGITRGRVVLKDRQWLTGVGIGGALAVLHPAYTYLRHGTPSLLLVATREGAPTVSELVAPLLDPSIGLIGNYPLFLVIVVAAAIGLCRRWPRVFITPEFVVAATAAVFFLYACAQTSNTHHGGTPSLSRYALWFIPLVVPLLSAARQHLTSGWERSVMIVACGSAAISIFAFHPGVVQNSREPTWLATWLWTRHPSWTNPLAEVFAETHLRREGTTTPAATSGCEKVLVGVGGHGSSGWPVPCYPADIPVPCRAPTPPCYANRDGAGYTFASAPGRQAPPVFSASAAWPAAAVPHVRKMYDEWNWWALSERPATVTVVRAVYDARAVTFGTDDRFLMIVRPRGREAAVLLRPAASRSSGTLVDVTTGDVLRDLVFSGAPGDLWTVPLAPDRPLQILAVQSGVTN